MENKLSKILLSLSIIATLFSGCRDKEQLPEPNVPVFSQINSNVEAKGADISFKVESSGTWIATTEDPWITISPANGNGNAICKMVIDSTVVFDERVGNIRITHRDGSKENEHLQIKQAGFPKVLSVTKTDFSLENYADFDDRFIEVEVLTNVDFTPVINREVNWLIVNNEESSVLNLDRGARPRKMTLKVDWQINTNPELLRETVIKLAPADETVDTVKVNVLQAKGDFIEDSQKGDSLAILAVARNINSSVMWDTNSRLINWDDVELWEATDEGYTPEKEGRVKAITFFLYNTKEVIPYEIRYLKYLESLTFKTNSNSADKELDLGPNVAELKNLKNIELFAHGLSSLDPSFFTMESLESISLNANNFLTIPAEINKVNFPNLKHFSMMANYSRYVTDLTMLGSSEQVGLEGTFNSNDPDGIIRFFMWEGLETLSLGVNFLSGSLPDMKNMGLPTYTQAEITASNDSIADILLDEPKVLPNVKGLRLNLNRFTGEIPKWILYHPKLLNWDPFTLVFNQEGKDRDGNIAGFDNEPANFEYYYKEYPIYNPLNKD